MPIFPLHLLITCYQLRDKVFSYSQLYSLTGLLPTEIIKQAKENLKNQTLPADPSLVLTQSTKNYQFITPRFFENYSSPQNFTLDANEYGASNQLSLKTSMPQWANYTLNDTWYWQQKKAEVIARWFYCLPFITHIYLCSSSALEISTPKSDLDLIIKCQPNTCLIVRLMTKTLLKIIGFDSYNWLFSLQKMFGSGDALENRIFDYKNRSGTKVDVGMFFENDNQILEKFNWHPQYLFIHYRLYISKSTQDPQILNQSFGSILCTDTHQFTQALQAIFRLFCWLILPFFILLSPLQSLWQHIKKDFNPSFDINPNFINFYPVYPEPKYLTKLW